MAERKLNVVVTANLTALRSELAKGEAIIGTTSAAMKRMGDSYDGSKTIATANAAMLQIDKLGGVTKLTEAEQRKLHSTLGEGLDKYKALGQTAPAAMTAMHAATQKVNAETAKLPASLSKAEPAMSGVEKRAVALGSAIGTFVGGVALSAVSKLGAEIGQFAQRGLQLNSIRGSFDRLASGVKESSTAMLSGMQQASRGMVSEFDLMKAANKAMLLGLPVTSESMNTLTKAATTLGRAMGQDATKSVDDLVTALGRSSPMILDNLGITVKVSDANEVYARKLGKTVEKLTEAEKKTAFYTAAMKAALEKTTELGTQTLTLSDYLGILWTNVGNKVSSGVATANVAAGSLISGLGEAKKTAVGFWESLSMGAKGAAFNLAGFGRTQTQVAAIMTNAVAPVKGKIKVTRELTEEEKALAKAFQAQVDILTGKALTREIEALAKEVQAAGKQGGLTAFQYAELGKQLEVFRDRGAKLPLELHNIWLAHERLNPSIKVTTNAYAGLATGIKAISMIPAPPLPLPAFSMDVHGLVKQIEDMLAMAGKNPRIKLAAAPVVKTWKDGFISFMGQAASDISNSIVSAIQGGGNVILAAVASLAQTVGQHFSAQFANAVDKTGKPLFSKAMAGILGGLTSGIVGVGMSIISDILKPSFTAMEILAKQFGKSVEVVTAQLKAMGETGAKAYRDIQEASFFSLEGIKQFSGGMKDARDMFGLLGQFQTKEELEKIAAQWKEVYDYMLSSGKYTAAQLAEAWKQYEDAQKKAIGAVEPEDKRPVGARGFPTKAQLQTAVQEAQEAYFYVRDSGLYTADVIEQAWQQWQDAMIASGDVTAKRMRELNQEILSLQKAVEAETPEYDADGVRIYGVEELRNIERLAALEKEKAALAIAAITEEQQATELAAAAASLQATKEMDAAKVRAVNLDDYLRKLFSQGYEIPITFRLPSVLPSSGVPGVPSGPSGERPFGSRHSAGDNTTVIVNYPQVRSQRDIEDITRQVVQAIPRRLKLLGAA